MAADVQLEDGWVRIANGLLEALYRARLPGSYFQVILAIIRLTYGHQRKSEWLSAREIADETGLSRPRAHAVMMRLLAKGMLGRQSAGARRKSLWWVVKDYDQWSDLSRNGKTDSVSLGKTDSETIQTHLSPPCKTDLSPPCKTDTALPALPLKDKRQGVRKTAPLTAFPELDEPWVLERCRPENNPTGRQVDPARFRIWLAWSWHVKGLREYGYTPRGFKRGVSKWWGNLNQWRRDGEPSDLTRAAEWFERLIAMSDREARKQFEQSNPSPPRSSEDDLRRGQEMFT